MDVTDVAERGWKVWRPYSRACDDCGQPFSRDELELHCATGKRRCDSCARKRHSSPAIRLLGAFHMIVDGLAAWWRRI